MKFKKKIRIIIGSLNIGGTEKQIVKIANNLANRGWQIEIITIILTTSKFIQNNSSLKIISHLRRLRKKRLVIDR